MCGDPRTQRHHMMTRGRYGERAETPKNIMHLCRNHHAEYHQIGRYSFCEKHGMTERLNEAREAVRG